MQGSAHSVGSLYPCAHTPVAAHGGLNAFVHRLRCAPAQRFSRQRSHDRRELAIDPRSVASAQVELLRKAPNLTERVRDVSVGLIDVSVGLINEIVKASHEYSFLIGEQNSPVRRRELACRPAPRYPGVL